MKKNILTIFSLVALIALSGCNKGDESSSQNSNTSSNNSSEVIDYNDGKYRVQVLLPNGEKASSGLKVQWCDDSTCKTADTNENGLATIELAPNNYDVHVLNYPEQYTCELGYVATSDNRMLTISLEDLKTPTSGDGTDYNPYVIGEGAYNVTIENEGDLVYFGFVPTKPGKYVIESLAENTTLVNPNIGYYGNNNQYVPESPINDMIDDDSGYDKNFSLGFNISIEEFVNTGEFDKDGNLIYELDENGNYVSGGIYRFGISATGFKRAKTFPFIVKWTAEYVIERTPVTEVDVTSTLTKYAEKPSDYVYVDAPIDGTLTTVYNEEDGFYHVDSKDGYVLTAKISEPCNYLDKAFSKVNEETQVNEGIVGERNIILDSGKKDYSKLVKEYEKYCNSDGVYGVTEELKVFLELYYEANKQWIESQLPSSAILLDEAGWLFACGYYADVADSYKKPVGSGTTDDPYVLSNDGNTYEYYAKVNANSSLYYSYALKNTMKEVHVYIKTSEVNAKFIYDEVEYVANEGVVYLEVDLGGGMATRNPNEFTFEMTTVDGNAANFVFEAGIREDTVAGDAIVLGENTVEVPNSGYVACSYKAESAGTYIFTCSEPNAWIEYNGKDYKGSDGTITFEAKLEANEVLQFDIYTLTLTHEYITFELKYDRIAKAINTATIGYESNGQDLEKLEYKLIADEEGGTYTIKPNVGTVIIVEDKTGSSSYWEDSPLVVTLKPNEEFRFLVTVDGWTPGNVAFTVTKS